MLYIEVHKETLMPLAINRFPINERTITMQWNELRLLMRNMQKKCLLFSLQKTTCKPLLLPLFLFLLTFQLGCGGGGGVYYPPEIAINTINLDKVELSKTGITSYEKQFFPVSYDAHLLAREQTEKGRKIFDDYGYFQEVKFLGTDYYLHKSYYFVYINIIRKSDMKKIIELPTPRGIDLFSSFPIMMHNEEFLVVYVQQRATSHSSTLFVIDAQFKIVYKEHLLGAIEIGYTHSAKYGNCIILKSEDSWFPNGIDKPEVFINGDWLYYIPDDATKNANGE